MCQVGPTGCLRSDLMSLTITFIPIIITLQINTEKMKQQNGCLDVNVPPDIDYLQTSQDVVTQEVYHPH